jgi:tRNA-2-methylthio-N6-dimethylallyladenosine synthase
MPDFGAMGGLFGGGPGEAKAAKPVDRDKLRKMRKAAKNARKKNRQMTKKVHVETWGCQMNVADSEKMLSLLHGMDYALTEDESEADLFLLNTCHIREKAKHKVISRLGVLRDLKKRRPGVQIAVTGCVAQAKERSS